MWTRASAYFLGLVHTLAAPLLFTVETSMVYRMARATENAEAALTLAPPLPKRVYVLAASDPMSAFYTAAVRLAHDRQDYETWSILSMAKKEHKVTRTGPRSLRLETTSGTLFDGGFVDVYRNRKYALRAGDTVPLKGGRVTVLSDDAGAPTAVELSLDVPLDDPTVAVLSWQNGALAPALPERIGASALLPWSPGPTGLF